MKKSNKIVSIAIVGVIIFLGSYYLYNKSLELNRHKYRSILNEVLDAGYVFVLPNEYEGTTHEKTAILFHDCDFNLNGIPVFVGVERELDIKSAFYIRPNSQYFFTNIERFQALEMHGWEIGFHYDTLSKSNGDMSEAVFKFTEQLKLLRGYFNIFTVRPHGDKYNFSIYNRELFYQNTNLETDAKIDDLTFNQTYTYIKDTNNKIVFPPESDWETLIIMNFHSDWWK